MIGAASCGENKYFYLVSLLEIGLIKYDFSPASQWLLGEKKINFQEGMQDRSFYFRHRWKWLRGISTMCTRTHTVLFSEVTL